MALSDIINNTKNTPTTIKGGTSTYRLYIEAAQQLAGLAPNTDPAKPYNQADWLINPDGADLSATPDVLLLRAHAATALPAEHPNHQGTINSADLRATYAHRTSIGQFHKAVLKHTGFTPDQLPQPVAKIQWPMFKAQWPIYDEATVTAGWALRLILNEKDYDTAHSILQGATLTTPLTHVAWMSLYYVTQRFDELADVATRAYATTFTNPADGTTGLTDETLRAIAATCSAYAHASLGRFTEAKPMATAAQESSLVMPAAYGHYIEGLIHRADGEETKAQQAFAASLKCGHTPQASDALSNPEHTLRVTSVTNIAGRTDYWDVETEPDPEMEKQRNKKHTQQSWRDQADALMSRVVGMTNVKTQVKRLRNTVRIEEERRRRSGATGSPANYNMVLTGPPGTGKSTIVKAITLYLAAEGIVDDPEPVITGKSDYVSGYIGQTPEKTAETVGKARGKVLFIDEFYQMVQDGGDGSNSENHGQDAIDTLVGLMEELVGITTFIIAGYPDDMDRVLQTNAGLESRFPRRIAFDSFDQEQFVAVAEKKAEEKGLVLSTQAVQWLADPGSDVRLMYQTTPTGRRIVDVLGNGRFARNVVERASEEQASRLAEVEDLGALDDTALNEITVGDVETAFKAYIDSALYQKGTG